MKKKKLKIIIFILLCIFTIILIAIGLILKNVRTDNKSSSLYNGLPVNSVCLLWACDTNTPEKAVNYHEYVVVAKVNNIITTEYRNPVEIKVGLFRKETQYDPYTVYSIEVIQNIKGDFTASETVEFIQFGGLDRNGKSYSFSNEVKPLKENEYYILLGDMDAINKNMINGTNPHRKN